MVKIFLDFETRSRCDLKKEGGYRYAADPSTEVLCLAVSIDGAEPHIWQKSPTELRKLIDRADTVHAHNAQFERLICRDVLKIEVPMSKWRCTAAKAAYSNLPRDLEGACEALGLTQQKDKEGSKLMRRLCKPQKDGTFIVPSMDEYGRLCDYCLQDVRAEVALDAALPDWPDSEVAIYHADQRVNDRGVYVDADLLRAMGDVVVRRFAALDEDLQVLTFGDVRTGKQVGVLLSWLKDVGVELPDLTADTVAKALERTDLNPIVRRVLEIRAGVATSSVAKITTMLRMRGEDGRIRGSLLYYGASQTGRWAGRGIQPQNMPRPTAWGKGKEDPADLQDEAAELILQGSSDDALDLLWGEPLEVVASCLRGAICAAPGKKLLCVDYSGIEARVLPWLARDAKTLAEFAAGIDPYLAAADAIYGCGLDRVTKEQRQIGKVSVLACGYQGWVGAFQKMAKAYGTQVSDDEAANIVGAWREAHEEICDLWATALGAAIQALRSENPVRVGHLVFVREGEWLRMYLPSGRSLAYYRPEIVETERHGKKRTVIGFWGVDSKTHKWGPLLTYGGKLVENATQAVARDLLADAKERLVRQRAPVILSVHDELVLEVPENAPGTVDDLIRHMTRLPSWAEGLPLAAAGWEGKRYRK